MDNQDKIDIIIGKLETLQFIINSYVDHAEEFSNKYNLEEVLPDCNSIKSALLQELEILGGTWTECP